MLNVNFEQQRKKTTKYTQKEMKDFTFNYKKSTRQKDYNEGNEKQKQK